MPKIRIDGIAVEAAEGMTLLKAARLAGIPIPHLCSHPAFPPEGNCRLCAVEVEGLPKLELACSIHLREGMVVRTNTDKVREARRAVLEFLLAEHPLDCPICDKAGECRLQDYYQDHGFFPSRFKESKTGRDKKIEIGSALILDRERCVACTRCVRFLEDMTRTRELGVFERGLRSVVGTYEGHPVENNYAKNLVDLCPVGAITDGDFRFSTRAWFLEPKASFCPGCGRGCSVWIDVHPGFARLPRTKRIFRVRPREHPGINGFWMCDRGRSHLAGLDRDRTSDVTRNQEGRKAVLSWDEAIIRISEKVRELSGKGRAGRIAVILNTFLSNEELFLAGRIFRDSLHAGTIAFHDPAPGRPDGWLLTSERTPNRRGAREMGFDIASPDWERIAEKAELLLFVAHALWNGDPDDSMPRALDRIRAKILIAPRTSVRDGAFEFVLPAAIPPEKTGSWTNLEGKVHSHEPALAADGETRSEGRIFLDLARELRIEGAGGLDSFGAIREEMIRDYPFFEGS